MMKPYRENYAPCEVTRDRVAYYWRTVLGRGANQARLKARLPKKMPAWGKLRLDGGRVTVRSAMVVAAGGHQSIRESSFIRVRTSCA